MTLVSGKKVIVSCGLLATTKNIMGGGEGAEPSDYELYLAKMAQERVLAPQVRLYGKDAMEVDPRNAKSGRTGLCFSARGVPRSISIVSMPWQSTFA